MREILFRGKTIANNSIWVEGFYNHIPRGRFLCDEHCIQTIGEDGRIGQLFDVYESTVGQFTGLTDKNGKKIFEGDVVKAERICNGETWLGFVVFWNGCFAIQGIKDRNVPAIDLFNVYEVIGNIHDNPELLEVGDD